MPRSVRDEPRFRSEPAAYAYVEAQLWANGRICPKCGVIDRSGPLKGKSTRIGVYKCYACRKPFTVKVGTIFESSHVPLHTWLQAMHLMCSSKKGFSANQFARILGVDIKTGWFLGHRIREAMRSDDMMPFGGGGGDVEVDETFIWKDPDARPTPKHANPSWVEKIKILGRSLPSNVEGKYIWAFDLGKSAFGNFESAPQPDTLVSAACSSLFGG
jgi:transposase-like protein